MQRFDMQALADFGTLHERLRKHGLAEVGLIWNEFLELAQEAPDDLEFREWVLFWRGSKALLAPNFEVPKGFRPEQVLYTLATGHALDHPIRRAALEWSKLHSGEPRLTLRFPPEKPLHRPLVISFSKEQFHDYCNFPDSLVVSDDGRRALLRPYKRTEVYDIDLMTGRVEVWNGGGDSLPLTDGRLLQIGEGHCEILDWDGHLLQELPAPDFRVHDVACTPDGKRVVLLSVGRASLFVWELSSGRILGDIPVQIKQMPRLSISDDGTTICLRDGHMLTLRIDENGVPQGWAETGNLPLLDACPNKGLGYHDACSLSRKGQTRLVEMATGQEFPLDQPGSKPADSLFQGDLFVVCNQEGDFRQACPVRVWDTSGEVPSLHTRVRLPLPGVVLGLSRDNKTLVGYSDLKLHVFSLEEPAVRPLLQEHDSAINGFSLSADGRLLASWSTDQTVKVFDLESGQCLGSYSGHGAWPIAEFSADGRWLLVSSAHGCWLWDRLEGVCHEGLYGLSREGYLASQEGHTLVVYQLPDWREVGVYRGHPTGPTCFACSPFGPQIVSGDEEGTLRVWDLTSLQEQSVLERGTPIRSLDWVSSRRVGFFPETSSNYHYHWRVGESQPEAGFSPKEPPEWMGRRCGETPDGQWSFRFEPQYTPKYLVLTHQPSGRQIIWPSGGIGAFRNNHELVVACPTGEIVVLKMEY